MRKKKSHIMLAFMLMTAQAVWAEKTAQVLWCSDNTTLYFINSETVYSEGSTYNDGTANRTITSVWSGEDVINRNNYFNYDATSIVFDESFKDVKPISTNQWFYMCKNLTSITGLTNLNTSSVTNMSRMFGSCHGLKSIDLSNFDTGKVTDMSYMFDNCDGLKSIDLSNFDTSKVTNMNSMFHACFLTSLDLSSFDTSNVTDMSEMFNFCPYLTSLDLSSFNTSKVTNMTCMFLDSDALTSLDLSNFNTSNVTSMSSMFEGCSALTSLDLSNFNTNNVEYMYKMFVNCRNLTSLDLSSFNTSNVTNMEAMFANCYALTSIVIGDLWNTGNVSESSSMFSHCTALGGEDGTTVGSIIDKTYAHTNAGGYLTKKMVSITPGNASGDYWATYYNQYANTEVPSGTIVFTAKVNEAKTGINLTEVTTEIIPKNTPVVLKTTNASLSMTRTIEDSGASFSDNNLKGSHATMSKPSENVYTLAYKNSNLGFYKFTGESLNAQKAYLEVTGSAGTRSFFGFGEGTTGIDTVEVINGETGNLYNLMGHKVTTPQKGIYVRNGKKIIIN